MERSERLKALRKILLQKLLKDNSARKEYESPKDRDTYNYGYMTSAEMGVTQEVA